MLYSMVHKKKADKLKPFQDFSLKKFHFQGPDKKPGVIYEKNSHIIFTQKKRPRNTC